MKAISLWQPWATLMAAGYKRIETRSWQPRGIKPGQLVAIHAAKRWTYDERDTCEEWPFGDCLALAEKRGLWNPANPPLGAVVAIARFQEAKPTTGGFFDYNRMTEEEYAFGNYGMGRYGWVFSEVRPLQPITTKGMQGIFDWTPPANLAEFYVETISTPPPMPSRFTEGLKCARCGDEVDPVEDYDPDSDLIMCIPCGKLPVEKGRTR